MSVLSDVVADRKRLTRWLVAVAATYAIWLAIDNLTGRGLPPGILVMGAVVGSLYSLNALGIILVYRANRIVNFAQAELGSVAAVITIELVKIGNWPYFLAIIVGIAFALVMGSGISVLVIRRFTHAPRLIVAVATIGLAQILLGLSILIPIIAERGVSSGGFDFPIDARFEIYPVVFGGEHIMVMVTVPLIMAALAWFLRYTHYGNAIRAAADNGDRAALVGIPVPRLGTIVWAIAGAMSAVAVIERTAVFGFVTFSSVSGDGFALLMFTLAAAVLARMDSMPQAVIAGTMIGVFQRGAAWFLPRTTIVDAMLFAVILIGLLVQKDAFNRAAESGISTFKALKEVRPIPTEMRRLPEVAGGIWLGRGLLVALVVGLPMVASISQMEAAALVAIYSIVALSLLILTGWAGHISLGQFAFVGFGAAASGKLYGTFGWDFTVAALGGVLTAAAAALLIGLPSLRIKGPFLAVTTLAFAVTASTFFLEERYVPWFVSERRVPRPMLWDRIDLEDSTMMFFFSVACLVGAYLIVKNLRASRIGRALIAVRDNELNSEAMAINATRVKLTAFVLSGALAGFAGAIYMVSQTGVQPGAFGPEVSIRLFSMVVIGGLGSVPGAILGAFYVRGAEFFLPPQFELMASGFGILVLLMFAPEGLGGIAYGLRDRYLRLVARRRNLHVPSLLADRRVTDDEGNSLTEPAAVATDDAVPEPVDDEPPRIPSTARLPVELVEPAAVSPNGGNGHSEPAPAGRRRRRPLVAAGRD